MLIILSPAKTFNEKRTPEKLQPLRFQEQTQVIVELLKGYTPTQLAELMNMSEELGEVNAKRYQAFDEQKEGIPAIEAYYGEVYKALAIDTLGEKARKFVDEHVRILSALYGMVQAEECIVPYRLEMMTKLEVGAYKDLYRFWGPVLTEAVKSELHQKGEKTILLNLASKEYSKVLDLKVIAKEHPVVTVTFKEYKQDKYKVVGMYTKKARGLMLRYLATQPGKLDLQVVQSFDEEGYRYNEALSTPSELVFTR